MSTTLLLDYDRTPITLEAAVGRRVRRFSPKAGAFDLEGVIIGHADGWPVVQWPDSGERTDPNTIAFISTVKDEEHERYKEALRSILQYSWVGCNQRHRPEGSR